MVFFPRAWWGRDKGMYSKEICTYMTPHCCFFVYKQHDAFK